MTSDQATHASSGRAFPTLPRVDRYFPARAVEDARNRLVSCVERGDGPALLIGASGVGKTLLLDMLSATLGDQFRVMRLTGTQLSSRRALLHAALVTLGRAYRDRDESELRLALIERLEDETGGPSRALLLVDEAQALSNSLLEELRLLTNLAIGGEPRVRMVLAGGPALEETFAEAELESFSQRLAARCYLGAMNASETAQYVRAHVSAVGAEPDEVFLADALGAVYKATDGVPRLINQLCDRALLVADRAGKSYVDGELLQAAWADLHRLPAPWELSAASAASKGGSVIEYGALADDEFEDSSAGTAIAPAAAPEDSSEIVQENCTPAPAVWNADDALEKLKQTPDELVAFLTSPRRHTGQRDKELQIKEPEATAPPLSLTMTTVFGDAFDDEEIVLDRYSSMERPLHHSATQVVNHQDAAISDTIQALATDETLRLGVRSDDATDDAIENSGAAAVDVDDSPAAAEEEVGAALLQVRAFEPEREPDQDQERHTSEENSAPLVLEEENDANHDRAKLSAESDADEAAVEGADDESDILLIEDDSAEDLEVSGVRRQEYRRLFASLKRG